MRALIELAFANLGARPARTAFIITLLLSGFLCQSLVRASYADLFYNLEQEQRDKEGDILIVLPETGGPAIGQWRDIRSFFLEDARVESILARASLSGLVGGIDGSAPASGIASEDSRNSADEQTRAGTAELGLLLAQGLSLEVGDECSALLNDRLYDLVVKATPSTEVLFKDRFWIEVPLSLLLDSGDDHLDSPLYSIAFRLQPGGRSSFEHELNAMIEQDNTEYIDKMQFAGSSLYSLENGNTRANAIKTVYEDNYLMIALAVLLVVFLALVNVLMLSCRERSNELGTLYALGARKSDLGVLMWTESIMLALFASILGIFLNTVISSVANAAGGIKLPPPPASTEPMILHFLVNPKDIAGATLSLLAASLCAPFIPLQWLIKKEAVMLLHGSH